MRGVFEQAEVHRHGAVALQPRQGRSKVQTPAIGSSEVAPGPQWNDAEHRGRIDRLSSFEKPVHHLVQRAIAPRGDDAVVAVLDRVGGDPRRVHRLAGELLAEIAERAPDRRARLHPALPGLAVRAVRIDHQEGLHLLPTSSEPRRWSSEPGITRRKGGGQAYGSQPKQLGAVEGLAKYRCALLDDGCEKRMLDADASFA